VVYGFQVTSGRGKAVGEFDIKMGYIPGAIGRVAELHGLYYSEHWTFGLFFEAKVAIELSEFLKRYDADRDGFWTVSLDGCVEGAIAIDGIHADRDGAHLRWFIMSDKLRGKGTGTQMIDQAIGFCRQKSYKKTYLWTFEGLEPARHLYEKKGFRLVEQQRGEQWGTKVHEQRYELLLD
jgi:GNAT superfamily N-acetyltransferase